MQSALGVARSGETVCLFRKCVRLFRKFVPLFRKSVPLFRKFVPLFRKSVPLFLTSRAYPAAESASRARSAMRSRNSSARRESTHVGATEAAESTSAKSGRNATLPLPRAAPRRHRLLIVGMRGVGVRG